MSLPCLVKNKILLVVVARTSPKMWDVAIQHIYVLSYYHSNMTGLGKCSTEEHFREYQTVLIMKAPIMKTYQRFMLTYFQLAPQENLISWRNLYTHINQSIKTTWSVLLESPSYCQNNSDPSVVSETWMLAAYPLGDLQPSNPSCR